MFFLTFIKKIYYKGYKRLAISPFLRCIAFHIIEFIRDYSPSFNVLSIISLFQMEKNDIENLHSINVFSKFAFR